MEAAEDTLQGGLRDGPLAHYDNTSQDGTLFQLPLVDSVGAAPLRGLIAA